MKKTLTKFLLVVLIGNANTNCTKNLKNKLDNLKNTLDNLNIQTNNYKTTIDCINKHNPQILFNIKEYIIEKIKLGDLNNLSKISDHIDEVFELIKIKEKKDTNHITHEDLKYIDKRLEDIVKYYSK